MMRMCKCATRGSESENEGIRAKVYDEMSFKRKLQCENNRDNSACPIKFASNPSIRTRAILPIQTSLYFVLYSAKHRSILCEVE